jgi:hypothetical protein
MVYDLKWSQEARCAGLETNLFFDFYEQDDGIARDVDEMCMSCPIQKDCLAVAVGRRETGTWGGIYLEYGQISEEHNRHKTEEDWGNLWMNLTTQMK